MKRWGRNTKKLLFLILMLICFTTSIAFSQDEKKIKEAKEQAIALYETKNFPEAYKLLDELPTSAKDEHVFLLLSNISQEKNDLNSAIQFLNKALDKNNEFYKAYYNLGCIFAYKKSYLLASNNFELALKYNKTLAAPYYNLAYCQIQLKNYNQAKKNLLKALELEPGNKDVLYNLAFCYKQLRKDKAAKRILDSLS